MEEPPRPLRIAPRPPVRVIGMPAEVVAMCFAEADSDRNGVIDGNEAVAYFKRSGLSMSTLASIWEMIAQQGDAEKNAKASPSKTLKSQGGLMPFEFSCALELIRRAQQGQPLHGASPLGESAGASSTPLRTLLTTTTQDIRDDQGGSCVLPTSERTSRPPHMGFDVNDPIYLMEMSERTGIPLTGGSEDARGAHGRLPNRAAPAAFGSELELLQATPHDFLSAEIGMRPSDNVVEGARPMIAPGEHAPMAMIVGGADATSVSRSLVPCLELRPRPIQASRVSNFASIASIGGCLLAFPTHESGGMRVWTDADGSLGRRGVEVFAHETPTPITLEPSTPLGAGEISAAPSVDLGSEALHCNWRTVTSIKSYKHLLVTGHEDGRIRVWRYFPGSIDDGDDGNSMARQRAPSSAWTAATTATATSDHLGVGSRTLRDQFVCLRTWSAHRSAIRTLAVTSSGDVWSGSEMGSIRTWDISSLEDDSGDCELSGTEVVDSRYEDALNVSFVELRRKTEDEKGKGVSAHASAVRYIEVSSTYGHVWTLGSGSVCIWSALTKQYIGQLDLHSSSSWSSDAGAEGRSSSGGSSVEYLDDKMHMPGKAMLGRIGKKIISSTSSRMTSINNRMARTVSLGMAGDHYLAKEQQLQSMPAYKVIGIAATLEGSMVVAYRDPKLELYSSSGTKLSELYIAMVPSMRGPSVSNEGPNASHHIASQASGSPASPSPLLDFPSSSCSVGDAVGDTSSSSSSSFGVDVTNSSVAAVGSVHVTAFASIGLHLWCCLSDGSLRIVKASSMALRPVRDLRCCDDMYGINGRKHDGLSRYVTSLTRCGSRVYTLANDGTIRGWSMPVESSDGQDIEQALSEMTSAAPALVERSHSHSRGRPEGDDVGTIAAAGSTYECTGGFDRQHAKGVSRLVNRDGVVTMDFCRDVGVAKLRNVSVRFATWNVNEQKPDLDILSKLVIGGDADAFADVVVVTLQEVEMSTSSVVSSAAVRRWSSMGMDRGGAGSLARWWRVNLLKALMRNGSGLDEGGIASAEGEESTAPMNMYYEIGSRQLVGMLICVFAKREMSEVIGDIETASIGTGTMGAGNKGSVAVQMSIYGRRVCFIGSHFAAHQGHIKKRNADCLVTLRDLKFRSDKRPERLGTIAPSTMQSETPNETLEQRWSSVPTVNESRSQNQHRRDSNKSTESESLEEGTEKEDCDSDDDEAVQGEGEGDPEQAIGEGVGTDDDPDEDDALALAAGRSSADDGVIREEHELALLRKFDVIMWGGDFNYRLNTTYREAVDKVAMWNVGKSALSHIRHHRQASSLSANPHELLDDLLRFDQLGQQRRARKTFPGFSEAPIHFPPTYKYDKGQAGLCFDSSEKQRIPSWTDRVLYRSRRSIDFPVVVDHGGVCDHVAHSEAATGRPDADGDEERSSEYGKIMEMFEEPKPASVPGNESASEQSNDDESDVEEDSGEDDDEDEMVRFFDEEDFSGYESDHHRHRAASSSSHGHADGVGRSAPGWGARVAKIDVVDYMSVADIVASDHKPVVAQVEMTINEIRTSRLRKRYCRMERRLARVTDVSDAGRGEGGQEGRLELKTERSIELRTDVLTNLDITNTGRGSCVFAIKTLNSITNKVQTFLPKWLLVTPTSGFLSPQQRVSVVMQVQESDDQEPGTGWDDSGGSVSQFDVLIEAREELDVERGVLGRVREYTVSVDIQRVSPKSRQEWIAV